MQTLTDCGSPDTHFNVSAITPGRYEQVTLIAQLAGAAGRAFLGLARAIAEFMLPRAFGSCVKLIKRAACVPEPAKSNTHY